MSEFFFRCEILKLLSWEWRFAGEYHVSDFWRKNKFAIFVFAEVCKKNAFSLPTCLTHLLVCSSFNFILARFEITNTGQNLRIPPPVYNDIYFTNDLWTTTTFDKGLFLWVTRVLVVHLFRKNDLKLRNVTSFVDYPDVKFVILSVESHKWQNE